TPPATPAAGGQTLASAPETAPLEPTRPLAPPQTEEDLLEIPSFLRRQAN
ncbi:MAG: hypothetical protein H8E30_18140, partial [Alphaproteobacteria bacterium]|nr:hypothetical protein [Alphaproteobacteria bacterium]